MFASGVLRAWRSNDLPARQARHGAAFEAGSRENV